GSKVFASSWSSSAPARSQSAAQLSNLLHEKDPRNPALLEVGSERYLSLVVPVEAHLGQPLYALIQGSYDRAVAHLHILQWRIAIIGAVALAGALLTGIILAGGITGPVRTLVRSMQEVLHGNLKHRTHVERNDEIGFLARSFNEMVGG